MCAPKFVTATQKQTDVAENTKLPSAQPNLLYVEPQLAIDPNDNRHLVSAAIAFPLRAEPTSMEVFGRTASIHVFVSFDDGASWRRQELSASGAGLYDPWIAFGLSHEVYLTCLMSSGETGETVRVYRSPDG